MAQEEIDQAQVEGEGMTSNSIPVMFEVDNAVSASSTIESPSSSKQTAPGCSSVFEESLASHRSFRRIHRSVVVCLFDWSSFVPTQSIVRSLSTLHLSPGTTDLASWRGIQPVLILNLRSL